MKRLESRKVNSTSEIKGAYDHLKKGKNTTSISDTKSTPGFVKIFFALLLIFVLFTGLGIFSTDNGIFSNNYDSVYQSDNQSDTDNLAISAILYSSPTCGCCHNYVDIMNENGFDVFQKRTNDYLDIKEENNIPQDHQSCHTMLVGNYFVEGHIPVDVVLELLNAKPGIDGIALAGMPSGSPGMGGTKSGTWDIYSILNGVATSIFMSV